MWCLLTSPAYVLIPHHGRYVREVTFVQNAEHADWAQGGLTGDERCTPEPARQGEAEMPVRLDEFDARHGGVVALARAELEDPQVATVALRRSAGRPR